LGVTTWLGCFFSGKGTPRDLRLALYWYHQSHTKDNAPAKEMFDKLKIPIMKDGWPIVEVLRCSIGCDSDFNECLLPELVFLLIDRIVDLTLPWDEPIDTF